VSPESACREGSPGDDRCSRSEVRHGTSSLRVPVCVTKPVARRICPKGLRRAGSAGKPTPFAGNSNALSIGCGTADAETASPLIPLYTGRGVEDVYLIGVFAGLGASLGLAVAGFLAANRTGAMVAGVLAAAVTAAVALTLAEWDEAIAGAVGGLLGGTSAGAVVSGALRRGGTRGATGLLVVVAALGAAVLALVPLVGYVEAVALPALARRLRRRAGDRHAGLRILARDEP
jgi:hypothetical protein